MRWFEVFFALIPIKISLKMFFFSDEWVGPCAFAGNRR